MPETPNPKLRETPPPNVKSVARSSYAYAELDVKTNFSFLCGASHADELVYRAAELGYRAIGITDVNTLAGVVRAHEAAKEVGLKLLVGSRLTFSDAPDLLVWASNRAGYARLCRMLTLGKRRAEKGECDLRLEDFLNDNEGLVAAVEGGEGKGRIEDGESWGLQIANCKLQTGDGGNANDVDSRLLSICNLHFSICNPQFPPSQLRSLRSSLGSRLSLIAACSYGSDDSSHLRRLDELSRLYHIPLLATNAVHYHDPSRRMLQDVLTCVRHGCTIQEAGFRLFPNGERYLKSPRQMHRLFADYPQALRRGLEIAEQCDFQLDSLRYEYPDELVPAGKSPIDHLSDLAWSGAAEHYPAGIPQKVRDLLNHELKLIAQLKFEAYFLTVHDLVRYARSRGILCQGRGSAANSAVCFCIGVTSVNPVEVDLLFERFMSAARNEPPDIDVDFEHERREEVIQYIYEKYGRERAGMTAEVITYRGRSAVRDVGKAMGLTLDMVDTMASKLDWWHRGVLSEPQLRECGLDPADLTIRRVITLATELLGFPRHLSQHVGGMVMTRGPLCELVPIENASMPDRTVIEWDKNDIDSLGILKVDVLALGMLTCISKGFKLIRGQNGSSEKIELHTHRPTDPEVYEMISNADTVGVFQVESRAQMSMLPRLRPKCFYDLVIEVAIVRPGPIQGNMVHPYLRRRCNEEPVVFPNEKLREVLSKTLGVPLFQEQAMRIAMVAAGFTADEADKLRRAMAAWRRTSALEAFHQKIVDGMLANGYEREFAEQCFNQIKGFGEYGFPESHAASFALLVYVSAWLKRYHPAAFAAALINSQPMGFYMPAQIVRDAKEHGVKVLPADVNRSQWDCTLEERDDQNDVPESFQMPVKQDWGSAGPLLRLGLRQLKGFRKAHAQLIVEARAKLKRFTSIEQLHQTTHLPVAALRILAEADAFGSLGLSRREALWEVLELKDGEEGLFEGSSITPSPGTPEEGRGEGDFEHQQRAMLENTLTRSSETVS
jgi:error-prone DNA polymerase